MLKPADRLQSLQVTMIRQILAEAPEGALNLGLGQTNEPVPLAIRSALDAAPSRDGAPYGPNAGLPSLRRAIAERYDVPFERVVVTAGVQEALALSFLSTVNPGDEVVVPEPGFPAWGNLARIAGASVVPWRLREEDAFRPSVATLEAALSPRTKLVLLNSPGNPTGAAANAEELHAIIELLDTRGIAWVSDEIYLSLQYGTARHPSAMSYSSAGIVCSGLAKSDGLAGWRLGWMVVPEELVTPVTALHQHLVTSASTIVQDAALGAFTREADAQRRDLVARLRDKGALARRELEGQGWEVFGGEGAFYFFCRHPDWEDDLELVRYLMRRARVITIPGRAFGNAGRGFVRVSYSVPPAVLKDALDAMGKALRDVHFDA